MRASYVSGASIFDSPVEGEGHTRTMATLVPDEIIYNISNYSKRQFETCLLFGDVSGFTDLCEKYNKSGKGGPSRLTQVLNNYIGAMVQEIMSHGGDVLSFSGDAFIALFKVTDERSMRDAVHEAIDCSLVIQKSYGTYQTDVDVVVRVKLAIACGKTMFSLVGNEESSHYMMTGKCIDAIKEAEHRSSAGEIIITARVSLHLGANEYLLNIFPDGLHAKVLGVGPNWRNTQRSFENKVRQAVDYAARARLGDELRKFIITPVVRGIEASEPLQYLTEIRRVAIVFVNCKLASDVTPSQEIDIAGAVYLAVYNVVKDRYGCVNKISNFDKDLMLLVIFGLRGFKHELECQIALKCARESFEKIQVIPSILTVSIGVTTGSCYCGAFGHTLRREYTVIGLVVNKAARLMVAYPKTVTCDRDTFLYSKLRSKNFILQEAKKLKGIANAGLIYEFKEVARTRDTEISLSYLPLLGRDLELDAYQSFLNNAEHYAKSKDRTHVAHSLLLFRGDHRQGKSRLLGEIILTTDTRIPILPISLHEDDREVRYKTIRSIFGSFIGLPEKTEAAKRERNIKTRLKHETNGPLFLLNDIFSVGFPITKAFENEKDRWDSTLQLLYKLSVHCFSKFLVFAVDDIDFGDEASWDVVEILLKRRIIFMVATIGRLTKHPRIEKLIKQEIVKIFDIRPIDNWYLVGLVCQMLGVDAITPELEKTLQKKSNGNPGWIESFLYTVLQSGGIEIQEISRMKAHKSGLVMSPPYMKTRISKKELIQWTNIMEEHVFSYKSNEEDSKRWKIFVGSCRESYPDLSQVSKFRDFRHDKLIQACFISTDFNLEDVEPEYHIDTTILKTFDSLNSYEQLLLKCSSVLGNTFPRDMLQYIMSSTSPRLIAMAVQKLFQIQVLSCAKGNFIEGGLNFKDRLIDPNEDMQVRCDCVGLSIEESCIDLPKYASCGYMRFRSSEFRKTTYDLLTDNQKREFHGKAIRYMEKETRRCRPCGSGYFSKHLGREKLYEGIRSKVKGKSTDYHDTSDTSDRVSLVGSIYSTTKSTSSRMSERGTKTSSTMGSFMQPAYQDSVFGAISIVGFTTMNKLKNRFNLVRTFSSDDYSQCTCIFILNTLYSQLIEHGKGAGLVEKIMDATIEYSYVCMETKNAPEAIKVLEEALDLLEGPMKEQIELDWMIGLKKGKLFTLIGRAKMFLDDKEAYVYLKEALHFYGVSFPTTKVGRSLLKMRYKLLHAKQLFIYQHVPGTFDEDLVEYCNNVAECLDTLCSFFLAHKKWRHAELAALWALYKALLTETDFQLVCKTYASVIAITTMIGNHRLGLAFELFALRMCHMKKSIDEIMELKAVCLLYFHVCKSRLFRGEIENALHMSFPLWRIASSSKSRGLLVVIFPMIAYINLLKKQIVEYGNILNDLLYTSEDKPGSTEKLWYHGLSLTLNLETGFTVESMQKCNQYIQSETFFMVFKEVDAKLRLTVCKWLWELRNENWEGATLWQKAAWQYTVGEIGEKMSHLLTGMYLLEGFIIYLVAKMDLKDYQGIRKVDHTIRNLMQKLKKAIKCAAVLWPRMFHLEGYYTMVKYDDFKKADKFLAKAKKIAEKHHNHLEHSWIEHSEQAWRHKLTTEAKYAWQERCEEVNNILYNDMDFADKLAHFSLPLPIYV